MYSFRLYYYKAYERHTVVKVADLIRHELLQHLPSLGLKWPDSLRLAVELMYLT
jgi:hypothetical protein